ncbi:hypothetical protein COO91_09013 [Nostoc flagelliforme CCNUN1]|uniref:Uncharacterized protein n=1 Tax=Nostoc flagelliforme CCNUN1 TaxID=2038116 RepID=A0A2K8T583_9NOSO|nr:hypothetical protein COO91_09013 [Nostoc flagelliforme CCNUN1]
MKKRKESRGNTVRLTKLSVEASRGRTEAGEEKLLNNNSLSSPASPASPAPSLSGKFQQL